MAEQSVPTSVVLSFGRFRLSPSERLLTADGVPIELGARTLDTLIVLASRPNEVVSKRELMEEVWPDVTVEEGSLRFHVAGLRRALGDGKDGARYITTLSGRGYCFVAPVARSGGAVDGAKAVAVDYPRASFLPARLARMVDREDSVAAIVAALTASRFVSIVGPGGVGKTTVALAVAHDLLPSFDGAAVFVDFGLLTDADMVPASVASMLGISIQSNDPVPSLILHLRDKRLLMVLDNCEHVVEAVAQLTSRIFVAATGLHILATSREAIRVEGERVHRLAPLDVPPDDPSLKAAATLEFPAARLFVERAMASGARLEMEDADAAIVGSICRRLDGMALAIELAAGRVEAYGLRQTAALLDQRFTLLWPGQRTAPARQKTLRATLDWSFGLLSEIERSVFRRLAAFVGPFSIEAALAVVTSEVKGAAESIDAAQVFAAIDSLVAKSMVTAFPVGAMMRYRLLDSTRAYALGIGVDQTERTVLATRHAAYCLRWLEPLAADAPPLSDAGERAVLLVGLNNVRSALEWCFGADGDKRLGVRIAAAATFAFMALSLTTECHFWSQRAIFALDESSRGTAEEMHLQAGLALSSMFTRENGEEARIAFSNSLAIADERGDATHQLRMLSLLHMFHHRAGNAGLALACATRGLAVASTVGTPEAVALARAQTGISLMLSGDLAGAQVEFEAALRQREIFLHGFDYKTIANGYLARVYWLRGFPARAAKRLRENIASAERTGRPVSLSFALSFAVPLLLWLGDLDGAEEHIDWFVSHTESNNLLLALAAAGGFKGQLAISRGDAQAGLDILEDSLQNLQAANYNVWTIPFNISLSQGLFALGRSAEAVTLVDDTIRETKNADLTYLPELLRLKAAFLGSVKPIDVIEVEWCLTGSLEESRRQGALASELRAATDLAAFLVGQDRLVDARAILRPVLAEFTEGFDTADLREAERLLATIG